MSTTSWKLTSRKSVNSKPLLREIHEYITMGMEELGVDWDNDFHRMSFVSLIEDMLTDLEEEDKIEQWDVCCDRRNNTSADMAAGRYVLDVKYKQRHCLNVTALRYMITSNT